MKIRVAPAWRLKAETGMAASMQQKPEFLLGRAFTRTHFGIQRRSGFCKLLI
jgi:hypothetical protein